MKTISKVFFRRSGIFSLFDFAISILGNLKNSGYVASGGIEIGFPEEFYREYGAMDYLHKIFDKRIS